MTRPSSLLGPGPFTADQIPSNSRYELSDGHPVYCAPTGRRGSAANLSGGMVLGTDPEVERAGVDLGVSPHRRQLRAPDVAVFAKGEPDAPGWAEQAPPIAVEYADTGQDEVELQARIAELLDAGTQHIWVVRLSGVRRVEVHRPGLEPTLHTLGQSLSAPGILRNPVPVEALFFHDAARRVALRNLLQREGFEDLDDVLAKGIDSGLREGLLAMLDLRGWVPSPAQVEAIARAEAATLRGWVGGVKHAASLDALLKG